MKLQLLIACVLKYVVLSNEEERGQQLTTYQFYIEDDYFNFTFSPFDNDDESASPCHVTVPGLNGLGLMVTYMVVFVFSLVGNSVVIYVVCSMKTGRSSTDIYLMHLAVADLLFSLTLPFWAIDSYSGWIFGTFLCKALSGFQEVSVYGGVFLLACISVDRHFVIVRATRILSSHHVLVKVLCAVVWVVAALLSLPVVIQRESLHMEELGENICYENLTGESSDQWRISARVLRHTMGFFLPLVVMAVCYGWTLLTLFHTRNQQRHKAIRVIIAVVMAFVLCWLPYNISVLVDTLIEGGSIGGLTCGTRYRVKVTLHVTQVLAFTHCAVNPVLYAFIGQKFRNQLLSALFKHGLISSSFRAAHRKSSVNSVGSIRSKVTSATM
ncbi:uncharacterized protein V6R79_012992 [Siganus canaliculatus]